MHRAKEQVSYHFYGILLRILLGCAVHVLPVIGSAWMSETTNVYMTCTMCTCINVVKFGLDTHARLFFGVL